uniref:Uncharacterized protein n=1 Tax=Peduovirinae sp. ctjOQ18 TaxID=2825161 RepID=A0A8S5P0S3_9CAUD|nr:MAG TPA: hypothetical protein [Peduovirinae sp. ctjOQ18]
MHLLPANARAFLRPLTRRTRTRPERISRQPTRTEHHETIRRPLLGWRSAAATK